MSVRYHTIAKKDDGQRLDRWLKQYYPGLPYSQMMRALRKGEIRLDGGRVKGKERLEAGQELRLPPQFAGNEPQSEEPNLTDGEVEFIRSLELYRDDEIIAINKEAGLATQGGTKVTQHVDRLITGLDNKDIKDDLRLIHRLDKETSGVLLLARTRKVATKMMRAFKRRDVKKLYLAVIKGVPKEEQGTIDVPLRKQSTYEGDRVLPDLNNGDRAVTRYQVIYFSQDRRRALIALWPETGRQHQLRAHMSYLNTPILGDEKYTDATTTENLFLHAYRIALPHKPGVVVTAPLPDHFIDEIKNSLDLNEQKAKSIILGLTPDSEF